MESHVNRSESVRTRPSLRSRPARRSTVASAASTTVSIDNLRVQYGNRERAQSTLTPPIHPIEIGFQNLQYVVPIDNGKSFKKVLKGVSGTFAPGSLVGILGASGAGKTSLLNAISGELKHGELYGDIMINGNPESTKKVQQISGFVYQEDVILPTMTVREAMEMSAKLRLPKQMPAEQVKAKLDGLISVLELDKAQNTVIGNSMMKGVSGGERKRAAIAMELVTDPPVLFLDEPTSGLDTYTAYAVMSLLSNLARSGRSLIATIHQPSSEIFNMLDDLLILAEGQVMYFGPADNAVEYFSHLGYVTPKFSNPADFFFMSILNKTLRVRGEKDAPEDRIDRLLAAWKKSNEARAVEARLVQVRSDADGTSPPGNRHHASMFTQFMVIFKRSLRDSWRNDLVIRARYGQNLFLAIFLGLVYLQIPNRDPQAQVQDFSGAIFFIPVNLLMSNATSVINVFAEEKNVFEREYTNGYYTLAPYYWAKVFADAPIVVTAPVLLGVIFYFMVGFRLDAGAFFTYLLAVVLCSACGQAFGMFATTLFDSVEVALVVVPMILLPLMLFGGLFVNSGSIPVYFDWIKWISPVKYAFSILTQTEFQGRDVCDVDNPETPCIPGQQVIEQFNLHNEGSVWFSMGMLFAWWFVGVIIAYFGLFRMTAGAKRVDVKDDSKMPSIYREDAKHSKIKVNEKQGFLGKFRKS